jgi:hypothetical protein
LLRVFVMALVPLCYRMLLISGVTGLVSEKSQ